LGALSLSGISNNYLLTNPNHSFCGTTADFCEGKCQSNCDKPKNPSCSTAGGSADRRTIGYWESWSTTRPCDAWSISDIDANKWTHLNFAFALIDKTTFGVAQMAPTDVRQYIQLTDLKRENPSLKVFISIGGWSAGGAVFSDMTSTSANRGAFIHSLQSFMKQYAFDGVDIDW
jgi:chitinase